MLATHRGREGGRPVTLARAMIGFLILCVASPCPYASQFLAARGNIRAFIPPGAHRVVAMGIARSGAAAACPLRAPSSPPQVLTRREACNTALCMAPFQDGEGGDRKKQGTGTKQPDTSGQGRDAVEKWADNSEDETVELPVENIVDGKVTHPVPSSLWNAVLLTVTNSNSTQPVVLSGKGIRRLDGHDCCRPRRARQHRCREKGEEAG